MNKIISTKIFNPAEIVDTIFDVLLKLNPNIKQIKIKIQIWDNSGFLTEPSFYFKTKNFKPKYKLYNNLNGSFRNFQEKNLNIKVSKYEIQISEI